MTIRMDKLIKVIATALDIVEGELLGASTYHGKRIAVLCADMGRYMGMDTEGICGLTTCALLHDNALTEYILSERSGKKHDSAMQLHCELGQHNVDSLNFQTDIRGFILYHHERADGSGPYSKRAGEVPLGAELIAIADSIDVTNHLQRVPIAALPNLREAISKSIGETYTPRAAEAMLHVLEEKMLLSLQDDRILETAEQFIPLWSVDLADQVILNLAQLVTRIIDYKSTFTQCHSTQIANKVWLMGGYYGYDPSQRVQVFLAAALHDLGKLTTPLSILEKPGALDADEFRIMKNHVAKTWELLKEVDGLETIRAWASNHHEKLDGTGYPFGKKADELDFNSRLMACIDIYQAVSEERPYHPRRNHKDTMKILYTMVDKGQVDKNIVRDLDTVLACFSDQNVPAPSID